MFLTLGIPTWHPAGGHGQTDETRVLSGAGFVESEKYYVVSVSYREGLGIGAD
ncbi:hypothetical protein CCP3SC1_1630001 [Gammaproteobacteria bacterium]